MLASEVALCFFFIGEDQTATRAAVALTLVDAGLFLWMLAADFASECADGFNHFSYQALRVSRQ